MLGFTSFNPTYTVVQMMIKAENRKAGWVAEAKDLILL
jgi:hypothetical protein